MMTNNHTQANIWWNIVLLSNIHVFNRLVHIVLFFQRPWVEVTDILKLKVPDWVPLLRFINMFLKILYSSSKVAICYFYWTKVSIIDANWEIAWWS